jgi:hypothetical protein
MSHSNIASIFCLCLLCPCLVFGLSFTFPQNGGGWEGDFTDYPVGEEEVYELSWGWSNLPSPVYSFEGDLLYKGLFLSGNNHSDDLFMFLRKRIGGLQPGAWYEIYFKILIENNVPEGMTGIGGSPGESVYVKVGAASNKPRKIAQDGFYYLNIDKGNQASGGENAFVIGNLANPLVVEADTYQPKELESSTPLWVQSNDKGEIWIFVGTDSGFEGKTLYYLVEVDVQILDYTKGN